MSLGIVNVETFLYCLLVVIGPALYLCAVQKTLHQHILAYYEVECNRYLLATLLQHLLESLDEVGRIERVHGHMLLLFWFLSCFTVQKYEFYTPKALEPILAVGVSYPNDRVSCRYASVSSFFPEC